MDAIKFGRYITLLVTMVLAFQCQAAVLFVVPNQAPQVMAVIGKAQQQLSETVDVGGLNELSTLSFEKYRAVVLVGSQVLEQWRPVEIPTLAILVSRQHYQHHAHKVTSAIFAEPSLHQQILLAEAIVGKERKVGILLQEPEQIYQFGLTDTEYKFHQLVVKSQKDYPSLNSAMQSLLRQSEVLVGVYDQKLYSSDNIKNILITSYRNNQALIGPTSAYLKAGAVASVYARPEDTAQRLVEVLSKEQWPAAHYNPHISVALNQQVARSLNLDLTSPEALAQKVIAEQTEYFKDINYIP